MENAGVFGVMGSADGWHWIKMSEAIALLHFATHNAEVQAVFNVCYTSLLAGGSILIEPLAGPDAPVRTRGTKRGRSASTSTPAPASRCASGTRIVLPDAHAEADARTRSRVFAAWARDSAFMQECVGFCPTTGVPDPASPDGVRPVVLNLARLQVQHRVDVYGRHFWRWFEMTESGWNDASGSLCGRRELKNILVLGNSLPSNDGTLASRVKCVRAGEYALLQSKRTLTFHADAARAKPLAYTQQNAAISTRMADSGSAEPQFDQANVSLDVRRDACQESHAVHEAVFALNRGVAASAVAARDGARGDDGTYEVADGRTLVRQMAVEAPSDLPATRAAYLESVCLAWAVPMSMLSAGDATGKAKLNAASASPETARIFREAQADRKRALESDICSIYEFLHNERLAERYVRGELEDKWDREGASGGGGEEKGESDDELADPTSARNIERATRMRVQIPCSAMSDQLIARLEMGALKYSAWAEIDAMQQGLPLSAYNATRLPPIDDASAAKKSASTSKSKNKSKNKSTSKSTSKSKGASKGKGKSTSAGK